VLSELPLMVEDWLPPVPQPCSDEAQSEKTPWLLPMILQNWLSRADHAGEARCHLLACLTGIEAVLGELLDLLHHLLDRGADLRGDGVDREVEDKGQRAIGRGLHAATIWSVLMKEKPPVKMSMPPQPALTLGIWSEPNW
jgi:hypothetical protein